MKEKSHDCDVSNAGVVDDLERLRGHISYNTRNLHRTNITRIKYGESIFCLVS